jgi:hypothetical protein
MTAETPGGGRERCRIAAMSGPATGNEDTNPDAAKPCIMLVAGESSGDLHGASLVDALGEISDGVEAQLFDVVVGPAAVNAVLGTALQSMRSRVLGETDRDEAQAVARLVLRLLGVPIADIDSVVAQAATTLAAT